MKTITVRIDRQHANPVAALRSGDLELPKLLAKLKPADTLRIVLMATDRMHRDVAAKALGLTA